MGAGDKVEPSHLDGRRRQLTSEGTSYWMCIGIILAGPGGACRGLRGSRDHGGVGGYTGRN